ncbi:hypothetical protein ACFOLD_00085 [Kocuria carniphila]|uniref:hypothetical protein n=1 Tax=Kocuria carniphila TaxID=262208 RepID=UPI003615E4B3
MFHRVRPAARFPARFPGFLDLPIQFGQFLLGLAESFEVRVELANRRGVLLGRLSRGINVLLRTRSECLRRAVLSFLPAGMCLICCGLRLVSSGSRRGEHVFRDILALFLIRRFGVHPGATHGTRCIVMQGGSEGCRRGGEALGFEVLHAAGRARRLSSAVR